MRVKETGGSIAVVGMSCRFPKASSLQEYWTLLVDGVDAITTVPPERFDVEALYDPTPGTPGKLVSRFGGFISDVAGFDAELFGLTHREASTMDPQHRIALELAWEALEDANLAPERLSRLLTGVFLASHASDYDLMQNRELHALDIQSTLGGARSGASGRISFSFKLQGPSLVVDADRASSLVAVHLACQSLRQGECQAALVGATNLVLAPNLSLGFSLAGMLAPDGRCKFGDASADGFVRSDGAGMLLLMPLEVAVAERLPVQALIRGSAVRHDAGRSGELVAPSQACQESLLRTAYAQADVSPGQVSYVEAHGTGTPVGDPVEIQALAAVMGEGRVSGERCRLGSVKTNIGHTEAAAGMAGLIKVLLMLEHRELVPSLHFEAPNPGIPFQSLPVAVQTRREALPPSGALFMGVSAFGLTGTSAHVVVQSAPPSLVTQPSAVATAARPSLLMLSGKSPKALHELASAYVSQLGEEPDHQSPGIEPLCAASLSRGALPHRLAVVAESKGELVSQLRVFLEGEDGPGLRAGTAGEASRVVFVLPGHGSQWLGMGRELLASEPVFRRALEEVDREIQAYAGWSVLAELRAEAGRSRLDRMDIVQPTLVAVEVALCALWRSWGVHPDAVLGTSMGEVAAAHVAGILELEDAVRIICSRSALMQRTSGKGGMAAVGLSLTAAREEIRGKEALVSIAASNSSSSTVLSGDPSTLAELQVGLEAREIFCQRIKVDVASHSPQMEPLLPELGLRLKDLRPNRPTIPMLSTVNGSWLDETTAGAAYWLRNLRDPVLFAGGVRALLAEGYDVFVEVSPHPVLWAPVLDEIARSGKQALAVSSLRRQKPERRELLSSLGALYVWGVPFDASRIFAPSGQQVKLPSYPWQRKHHWYTTARTPAVVRPSVTEAAPPLEATASDAERPVPRRQGALAAKLERVLPGQRRQVVSDWLRREVAKVLELSSPDEVDVQRSFREMGLKSLMTTELRHTLARALDRTLPASLFFNHPNIEALAAALSEEDDGSRGDSGDILVDCRGTKDQLQRALDFPLSEPLAIIGMGCRFPGGVDGPESYWKLLASQQDAITEVPKSRWDVDALYDADSSTPGKMATRWGGFVDDVEKFDADFFGISPREAAEMDPQHRLLLEVTWEALERAAHSPQSLHGSRTGVFFGISSYSDYTALKGLREDLTRVSPYHGVGVASSIAAGRVSYLLGLRGPSMVVDTACSSSLVALHLGAQSLRAGECRMAVVGGVNLVLSPENTVSFSRAGMMAPDGRCKTFDAAANGYVRSDGCGVVLVKRLSDALLDEDDILALVTGTAVNQDGRSSGLTAPNGAAQQDVLRAAMSVAGISGAQVEYVEAHGTGTPLGDPIEIEALQHVLGPGRSPTQPVYIGSVKTNIGHTEAAAGIAGLQKVVLSLQHREIPGNLHFHEANPQLSLHAIPAVIPTSAVPWVSPKGRRIAGVSAFGFSGTNAHAILEEAPVRAKPRASPERSRQLLTLSAKGEEPLRELARRFVRYLTENPSLSMARLCASANRGRAHFRHRLTVHAESAGQVARELAAFAERRPGAVRSVQLVGSSVPRVGFSFEEDLTRLLGVARKLVRTQPRFIQELTSCEPWLKSSTGGSLLDALLSKEAPSALSEPGFQQAALVAIHHGSSEMWRSWGIEPWAVSGDGVGTISAALAARMLPAEDALRLARARGRLLGGAKGGTTPGEEARQAFALELKTVRWSAQKTVFVSACSGRPVEREQLQDLAFWCAPSGGASASSVVHEVLTVQGCQQVLAMGAWGGQWESGAAVWTGLLDRVSDLYLAGAPLDWSGFEEGYAHQRLALPTHAFDRKTYWVEGAPLPALALQAAPSPKKETVRRLERGAALQRHLRRTISRIVQVPEERISLGEDFTRLAMDSLMMTELAKALEEELGRKIPLTKLIQATSVERLEQLLAQPPGRSALESSLVELHEGHSEQPLFLVHPSGGGVLCFAELAKAWKSGLALFGLQSRGWANPAQTQHSVEEMAAHYVEQVRAQQATGPYRLAGWSMGASVAFEMALQLRESGERVASLILIDPPFPPEVRWPTGAALVGWFMRDLARREGVELPSGDGRASSDTDQVLAEAVELLKEVEALPPVARLSQIKPMFELFRTNLQALAKYEPHAYDGELTIIQAAQREPEFPESAFSNWSRVARRVTLYSMPGDHFSIMRSPHVTQLAELLAGCLETLPSE